MTVAQLPANDPLWRAQVSERIRLVDSQVFVRTISLDAHIMPVQEIVSSLGERKPLPGDAQLDLVIPVLLASPHERVEVTEKSGHPVLVARFAIRDQVSYGERDPGWAALMGQDWARRQDGRQYVYVLLEATEQRLFRFEIITWEPLFTHSGLHAIWTRRFSNEGWLAARSLFPCQHYELEVNTPPGVGLRQAVLEADVREGQHASRTIRLADAVSRPGPDGPATVFVVDQPGCHSRGLTWVQVVPDLDLDAVALPIMAAMEIGLVARFSSAVTHGDTASMVTVLLLALPILGALVMSWRSQRLATRLFPWFLRLAAATYLTVVTVCLLIALKTGSHDLSTWSWWLFLLDVVCCVYLGTVYVRAKRL